MKKHQQNHVDRSQVRPSLDWCEHQQLARRRNHRHCRLDSRFWKATKRLRRPAPPAASHNQPVAVPAQAPYGCVPAAVPAGSVPRPWAQVKSRFSVSRHARTRPQQSPAHQPASSKCGSRHCQGYAFEESAATVRGDITSRKCACQQWHDVAPAPIVKHEGRPLEKANCDSNGSVVLNCLMNVVVQRVLFSSCQQWMYLYYYDYFVETCNVVYVRVINSPNRHSDSPNCNVINKALRDEFAVSHGIGKRASPDHGLDSTIPVTMWTFPVTFCCRSMVPVIKTSKFQPRKWTLLTPRFLVALGSMRHVMTITRGMIPIAAWTPTVNIVNFRTGRVTTMPSSPRMTP